MKNEKMMPVVLSSLLFMGIPSYAASPKNVEHLPSVTLNKTTMANFTDTASGITFSHPQDWKESKGSEPGDIVKFEGTLDGRENGEIKFSRFESGKEKVTTEFAKSAVHQYIFTKLPEFKSLQEKKVAIGSSRKIQADLEDVEFSYSGVKVKQRYVYFATTSGTYHFIFTSPASHFEAVGPLYNNVLLSIQTGSQIVSKTKQNSAPAQPQSVSQKRLENAQLPFSLHYPGSWKVEPSGNRDEVAKIQGQGPKGELAYIVVNQGEIQPDWTLEQIADSLEKEFFESQPKFRRLSKQAQDFGSMSKVRGVVEEHTFEMNGAPVKQMVAIFTNVNKAYAVSLVTVGWKDGDTRQLFAKTLAGIKMKD